MSNSIPIQPVSKPIIGTIRPPGSKSLTNRALLIAALADGTSTLHGILDSVDTRVMVDGLQRLGIHIDANFDKTTLNVTGKGGRIPAEAADLWCENSGTSIRFLTAFCSIGNGTYRLDGNQRMRERPIRPLIDALQAAGIDAKCELGTSCPPVSITTTGLNATTIEVDGGISSQYLSGLLMIAPAAKQDITIKVTGNLVSRPYIDMTLAIMRTFGAEISELSLNEFLVASSGYQAREYDVEPDASAASYFFAAAAITDGCVTVEGLRRDALQGDIRFVDALEQMGCEVTWGANSVTVQGRPLKGIDIDMNQISDTAQTLACVAPFADGPTRIRNVAHNRVKETDRISAVVIELQRAGIQAEEHEDGMTIHPGPIQPAVIHTYDDHRMAMSFALLGLRADGIEISDPECTSKTYPHYFEDLDRLRG